MFVSWEIATTKNTAVKFISARKPNLRLKIRFFVYFSLGGGALTSLVISASRVAAALSGVNQDLLQESALNVAVDLAGIVVLAVLIRRDLEAQASRLKRASKGAELAKLVIRASKSIMPGSDSETLGTFTTSLASLRRGRGIEKRVVIAVAGKEKIDQVIKDASMLEDSLSFNDLIVVPVVVQEGRAPAVDSMPNCVALPVGANWKAVVTSETEEAQRQGIDVEKEGCCLILKKNGRVGQRTEGIFLDIMVGEVTERREMGFDVKNI